MRMVWFVLLTMMVCLGRAPEVLVLTGSRDAKLIRMASLKLQLAREENAALASIFNRYGIKSRVRTLGTMHALMLEPVRSLEAHNVLIMALSRRYPGMVFVRQSSSESLPGRGAQRTHPPAPGKALVHSGGELPLDWVWAAIFMLALVGLVGSVYQRKRMVRFSREQTTLQAEQERIDETIEYVQGGKHG